MPESRADTTVRIVGPDGDPDMTVAVVGDQVVDLSGAAPGDVLVVQEDGTLAPAPALTDEVARAEAREAVLLQDEIASIDILSILQWKSPVPAAGIANAVKRTELSWSFIPDEDMEVEFVLSTQLVTPAAATVVHLSLLDTVAIAAGQSNIEARILGLVTPGSSGITGISGFTQSSSGRRFCPAGVLRAVAAFAWFSGTAPTAGATLCNGPAALGNAPHTSLRIKRVG